MRRYIIVILTKYNSRDQIGWACGATGKKIGFYRVLVAKVE
jgi:hypothetical protein